MGFEGFAGNARLKKNLISSISSGKLPHAIILQGENGLGKKTLAKYIAASLLCEGDNKPCGSCKSCRNILSSEFPVSKHPDVLYFKRNKDLKTFTRKIIDDIRDQAYILPNQSDYKIFIIDETDYMNESAQNTFLKVLEEPPAYVVFILLCEHKNNFLETILSRCTIYSLEPVTEDEAVEFISEKYPETDVEEIRETAGYTGGNIGKIILNLKNEDAQQANETAVNIAEAMLLERSFELLKAAAEFDKNKALFKNTMKPLKSIFRTALIIRCGGEASRSIGYEQSRRLSKRFTKKQLFNMIKVIDEIELAIEKYINHKLLITKFCADLHTAAGF